MIELRLNGEKTPSSLLTNTVFRATFLLDGRDVTDVQWTLSTPERPDVKGSGPFAYTPLEPKPITLHYTAFNGGVVHEGISTLNVSSRATSSEISVSWQKLQYSEGETLIGIVVTRDAEGLPPRSVTWELLRNNTRVADGTEARVVYQAAPFGIYRVIASVLDHHGNLLRGESTVFVTGQFEAQTAILPQQPQPSSVLLGSVYTHEVTGSAGVASSLPYQLAAYTQELFLLPGTTHFSLELDPAQAQVDDEVVVRTHLGNWTLRNVAGGLTTERVGYDYQPVPSLIPAPYDGRLKLTLDAFNVHGYDYGDFNFRVRLKCYKNYGQPIYKYEQCPYSTYPGGEGKRFRKFAALFSEVEVGLDTGADLNRFGSASPELFSTDVVTTVPLVRLSTDGQPNPVPTDTGVFFTSTNLFATYESPKASLPDLAANAVSGVDALRPFLLSLQMPGLPVMRQTVKRLRGKLAVYMAGGSLAEGSTVTVTVHHGKSPGSTSFAHVNTKRVYVDSDDTFQHVFELDVDIADYQFSHTGVLVSFAVTDVETVPLGPNLVPAGSVYTGHSDDDPNQFILNLTLGHTYRIYPGINESDSSYLEIFATNSDDPLGVDLNNFLFYQFTLEKSPGTGFVRIEVSIPTDESQVTFRVYEVLSAESAISPLPVPVVSDDYVYSTVRWNGLSFDGACYTNPVVEVKLESENYAVRAVEIPDCARPQCGPVGEYCYISASAPSEIVTVAQPLYFPAPYIAYGTAPHRCFTSPALIREISGTIPQNVIGYTTNVLCGDAYVYLNCARTGTIAVVYPSATASHPFVAYASECYERQGAWASPPTPVVNTGTLTLVSVGSVAPVSSCSDATCTGADLAGSAVGYTDIETGQKVNVVFTGLDMGIPRFAVARERTDTGLDGQPPGETTVRFERRARELVMRAAGGGRLHFHFGMLGHSKKLVVLTGSSEQVHTFSAGASEAIIDVSAGSDVYLDAGNEFGSLSKRVAGMRVRVSWTPVLSLPRVYDTALWSIFGSQTVRALGFTGLTNRQDYTVFRTLPFDGSSTGLVNPNSIVTILSAGKEYALVRNKAAGEPTPRLPENVAWYAGESLSGVSQFKFYASSSYLGAHGEMDVWFSAAGAFPGYFQVNRFTALARPSIYYRRTAQVGDTDRNAVRVLKNPAGIYLPVIYTAEDGEQLSVVSTSPAITYKGKTYVRS